MKINKSSDSIWPECNIRKNLKSQWTSNFTNIIDEEFDKESDVFSIIIDKKSAYSWILDSECSFYMCQYKEWFDIYKKCDVSTIPIRNDSSFKLIGIGTIKVRILDGVTRASSNIKYGS